MQNQNFEDKKQSTKKVLVFSTDLRFSWSDNTLVMC